MSDRPRIRDVASLAGTSISTVSNLLNGRPDRMSLETVRRIETAIGQLAYRPHWAARQLKTGIVPMLGLLVPSVANPSHGAMARAVEVAAEARGLQVVLGNTLRDRERERRYASNLLDLGIRGIIVASSPFDLDHFADLIARGLRLVALDLGATLNGVDIAVDSVSVDNSKAGYLATRHLIDLGHVRIGYISGATATVSRSERHAGYELALTEAGLPLDPAVVSTIPAALGFDDTNAADHGRAAAVQLLERPDRPTGIVAFNDMHALGACAAARDQGLVIPDDISVVGIDDILLGGLLHPPLTTVHQPVDALGAAAVELLITRLGEETGVPPRHVILEPYLVARASAATPGEKRRPEKRHA
jgi:DNA-binding LacI/PurR family transcriptional regulator